MPEFAVRNSGILFWEPHPHDFDMKALQRLTSVVVVFCIGLLFYQSGRLDEAPHLKIVKNPSVDLPIRNKLPGLQRKAERIKWFVQQRTYPLGYETDGDALFLSLNPCFREWFENLCVIFALKFTLALLYNCAKLR